MAKLNDIGIPGVGLGILRPFMLNGETLEFYNSRIQALIDKNQERYDELTRQAQVNAQKWAEENEPRQQ